MKKDTEALFKAIFKLEKSGLMRGISHGMTTDQVIHIEGQDYYEETFNMPHLEYLFEVPGYSMAKFEMVYYFNKERLISGISLFLAYNPKYYDLEKETFEELAERVRDDLKDKFGEPKFLKERTPAGIHLEYTWNKNADQPDRVDFMLYDEELNGNERVMKVIFS